MEEQQAPSATSCCLASCPRSITSVDEKDAIMQYWLTERALPKVKLFIRAEDNLAELLCKLESSGQVGPQP